MEHSLQIFREKSLQNGLLLCYALGSLSIAADFRLKKLHKNL